jgi:hypothetical protein
MHAAVKVISIYYKIAGIVNQLLVIAAAQNKIN